MIRMLLCPHCDCMVEVAAFDMAASRCRPCMRAEHALYRYWRDRGTPLRATRGRVPRPQLSRLAVRDA